MTGQITALSNQPSSRSLREYYISMGGGKFQSSQFLPDGDPIEIFGVPEGVGGENGGKVQQYRIFAKMHDTAVQSVPKVLTTARGSKQQPDEFVP